MPLSTAALGPGSWDTQSSPIRARNGRGRRGTARAPRASRRIAGSPNFSANSSGVKAAPQAAMALSSTGISMTMPARRLERDLEGDVGPQRGAPHDGAVYPQVIQERHRLLGERADRVTPGVQR